MKRTSIKIESFTKYELGLTATGTALVIDDAEFGLMAIIPMKDKTYLQMWISEDSLRKVKMGSVIELNKALVMTVRIGYKSEKYLMF